MDTIAIYLLGILTGISLTVIVAFLRSGISLKRLYGPRFAKVTVMEPGFTYSGAFQRRGGRVGPGKIHAIKEIRQVTKMGLKEAKEMTEGRPFVLPREQASELVTRLRSIGVRVGFEAQRRAA